MKKITTFKVYNKTLKDVYELMQRGENNLTERDANRLLKMANAIQGYEKIHYPFPMPKTIGETGY